MPTIIIMNNATEQMLGRRLNSQQALFAAQAALRNIWLACPGDIVIATARPDDDFLSYLASVLGWKSQAGFAVPVHFVIPATGTTEITLTDEMLLDPETIHSLREAMGATPGWSMLACYQTSGTARLQEHLCLADSLGAAIACTYASNFGTDLLNRKSHFRQLAIGTGLPVPEGAVVQHEHRFREVVDELLPLTGNVIVKLDNGAGGTGNTVLSASQKGPFPGSCETISLQAVVTKDREERLSSLWRTLQERHAGPVVVEAYYEASAMFYLEFLIGQCGQAKFLNSGSIRLRHHTDPAATDLFWVGLELPAEIPAGSLAEASLHCGRFLQLAALMGYRGHMNIDAIITRDHRLLFNESNARWGGGTVLHEVATRLLGSGFTASHVAASVREMPSPGFQRILRLLERSGLAYSVGRRSGIVVLACDDVHMHIFEALVIATSVGEVRSMEKRLVELLECKVEVQALTSGPKL